MTPPGPDGAPATPGGAPSGNGSAPSTPGGAPATSRGARAPGATAGSWTAPRVATSAGRPAPGDQRPSPAPPWRVAADEVPAALVRLGPHGGAVEVNREWSALTGLDRRASLGPGWLDAFAPPSREAAATRVAGLLATGGTASGEWQLARDHGDGWVAAVIRARGGGALPGCTLVLHDVTARRVREEERGRRAGHDDLTGLPNRRVLADRADRALARMARRPAACAILFIDLDGFKVVNDRLGHRRGDALLVGLAGRLTRVLRPTDTLVRVGGDEFVVLCEDVGSPAAAVTVAQRVLAATRRPVDLGGASWRITASIGVAFAHRRDETVDSLVGRADAAMYRAKGNGGDRVEVAGTAVPAGGDGPGPGAAVAGDLDAIIVDLRAAAESLSDLAARGAGGSPAHPAAVDDAAHSLRRALDVLRDVGPGPG